MPTLTSVTRQSIFAGEPPLYFPDSLATTSKEKTTGCGFGRTREFSEAASIWSRTSTAPTDPKLEAALANAAFRSLGIVWNKVDDIMHGMQMQTAGCTTKCGCGPRRDTCNNCSLASGRGFAVYLTADHGNVTATGIGNPKEGVLAETKGKRVRVYDRRISRGNRESSPIARWPNYGLPPARHVLLAGNLKASRTLAKNRVPRRNRPGRSLGSVRGDHQGGNEEGCWNFTGRSNGRGWMPCWIGSSRRPTRRNCGLFWTTN